MILLNSQRQLRQLNRSRALNQLRLGITLSRAELARGLGVDKKTITNLSAELIAEGWMVETGLQSDGRGRPQMKLSIAPERVAIGIELQPDQIKAMQITPYGTSVQTVIARLSPGAPEGDIRAKIAEAINTLGITQQTAGVGLVIPAGVEAASGLIQSSALFPHLVGRTLESLLPWPGCARHFESSSKAQALAEKWFGHGKDLSDFLSVELGHGVGSGLIINRKLYKGAGGLAGEVGHICIEPGGRRCGCGNHGCLEAYVGGPVLESTLNEAGFALDSLYESLFAESTGGIPEHAAIILKQAGFQLGKALGAVANIASPTAIILNGKLSAFLPVYEAELHHGLRQTAVSANAERVRVLATELQQSACLGAACLCFSEVFEIPGLYDV